MEVKERNHPTVLRIIRALRNGVLILILIFFLVLLHRDAAGTCAA